MAGPPGLDCRQALDHEIGRWKTLQATRLAELNRLIAARGGSPIVP